MEHLNELEIKKISRKFKIPENDIITFLADEDRLLSLSSLKESFLKEKDDGEKINILQKWSKECKNFCDFEDFYVIVSTEQITEQFFFDWLKTGKNYKERRDVYHCIVENENLRKRFVKAWIEVAEELEDIREAMSYSDKNREEYRSGIKKITLIYKN